MEEVLREILEGLSGERVANDKALQRKLKGKYPYLEDEGDVKLRRWIGALFLLATTGGWAQTSFAIGQVKYGGGGDWYSSTASIANWLREIRARLGIPTERAARVVSLTDRNLWQTPFLYINGHGNIRFSDAEVRALRNFLSSGGFLFINDDYGLDPSIRRELARVYPDRPLEPIPPTHPIYHCYYDLPGLPKIHLHDGDPAQGFGIFEDGRMVVFYAWSSDVGDGLEAYDVHKDPPEVREMAIRMAINLVVYALTH